MIGGPSRPLRFRAEMALFLILIAGALMALWWQGDGVPLLGQEAVIRLGVGQDLLDGLSRGRQGLIGSLRWAPLPTLLLMPVLRLPAPFGGNWAPIFVAVAVSALLCAFLSAWLARCGVAWAFRIIIAVAVFASPAMWHSCRIGASEPLFLLLVLSTLCFLMHWWETGQLRSLAYLALSLALALITRYEAILLLMGAAGIMAGHLFTRRRPPHYTEATLTIFLVPAVYVVALWVVCNWLIMGDAFFFARGLVWSHRLRAEDTRLLGDPREWAKVFLVCAVALAAWRIRELPERPRPVWGGWALIFICVLLGYVLPAENLLPANNPFSPNDGRASSEPYQTVFVPNNGQQSPYEVELAKVVRYVAKSYSDDWIVYSGYRGYELEAQFKEAGAKHFLHTLSLYPNELVEKTRGKRTFLLVPISQGDAVWEDVNLKYPDLFERGTCFTVFEYSWRSWVLVRLVRLDEIERS